MINFILYIFYIFDYRFSIFYSKYFIIYDILCSKQYTVLSTQYIIFACLANYKIHLEISCLLCPGFKSGTFPCGTRKLFFFAHDCSFHWLHLQGDSSLLNAYSRVYCILGLQTADTHIVHTIFSYDQRGLSRLPIHALSVR